MSSKKDAFLKRWTTKLPDRVRALTSEIGDEDTYELAASSLSPLRGAASDVNPPPRTVPAGSPASQLSAGALPRPTRAAWADESTPGKAAPNGKAAPSGGAHNGVAHVAAVDGPSREAMQARIQELESALEARDRELKERSRELSEERENARDHQRKLEEQGALTRDLEAKVKALGSLNRELEAKVNELNVEPANGHAAVIDGQPARVASEPVVVRVALPAAAPHSLDERLAERSSAEQPAEPPVAKAQAADGGFDGWVRERLGNTPLNEEGLQFYAQQRSEMERVLWEACSLYLEEESNNNCANALAIHLLEGAGNVPGAERLLRDHCLDNELNPRDQSKPSDYHLELKGMMQPFLEQMRRQQTTGLATSGATTPKTPVGTDGGPSGSTTPRSDSITGMMAHKTTSWIDSIKIGELIKDALLEPLKEAVRSEQDIVKDIDDEFEKEYLLGLGEHHNALPLEHCLVEFNLMQKLAEKIHMAAKKLKKQQVGGDVDIDYSSKFFEGGDKILQYGEARCRGSNRHACGALLLRVRST